MADAIAKASWKLTLEITTDDGEGGPSTTTLSETGSWTSEDDGSPVNECIAIDMNTIMQMLSASGHLIGDSGMVGTVDAFCR